VAWAQDATNPAPTAAPAGDPLRRARILCAMERACLVAGCGYVGRRLAVRLRSSRPVLALARSPGALSGLRMLGIDTIGLDFDRAAAAPALADAAHGGSVVYLAPPPASGTTDPRLERFLALLGPARPEVFIYLSTTGVYGDTRGAPVDESSPAAPADDRSRRRLAAEQAARDWCRARDVRAVVFRVPGIYGPGRLPLDRLRRGEPVLRPEDAGPGNRIHVDDLVSACVAAIDRPVRGVFNVGDGDHASTTEFTQKTAELAGLPPPPLVSLADAPGRVSPGLLEYLLQSRRVLTQRMREELGVVPRYATSDSGIMASLAEMRASGGNI
jgi:nucleoside-diphosphate-sugar epimerase